MDNDFEIPVTYNGKELTFPAKLLNYGFTVKLEIDIDNTKIMFEPDEERYWRALISYEDLQANKKLNPELLKLIASEIEKITQ